MENKPYFCKYIPVEGEINSGDFFIVNEISEFEGCIWPTGRVTQCRDMLESLPAKICNYNGEYWPEDKVTKAQLHLCSRDIQVGDENVETGIIHEEGKEIVKQVKAQFQLDFIKGIAEANKTIPFKVIGLISPEATWITEGMEFEKSDWEFSGRLLGNMGDISRKEVRIKGPCGHFH